ncbi:matrixin family metalloprotease [Geodermatophilus sp. SYSU D01106]
MHAGVPDGRARRPPWPSEGGAAALWPPAPGLRRPALPRSRVREATAAVLALGLLLWLAGREAGDARGADRYDFRLPEGAVAAAPAGTRPSPGVGASAGPLGTPPPAPAAGTWEYLGLQDDGASPVAYDPCRAVHWVLRPDDAPAGAEELVTGAVAEVAAATGLTFVHDGSTDERVTRDRPAFQPARYGDRWAPVLVSFEPPAANPDVGGGIAARGGSDAVRAGGRAVYVTGSVLVDADWAADRAASPEGRDAVSAVLVHELAHVVGLGHVEDAGELMYAHNDGQRALGPGDRAGLARLGEGECEPDL